MAHFDITLDDFADNASFGSAVGRNMHNATGTLKTSASVRGNVNINNVSYSISDVMQGEALHRPFAFTADAFNQSLSSDEQNLLNINGPDATLGERKALLPWDVLTKNGLNDGLIHGPSNGQDFTGLNAQGSIAAQNAAATGNIVEIPGITGGVDASVADAVTRMIADAAAEGVTLTGGGWRSQQRQIELRSINGCPDVWDSPASSCRVPTAIPGHSQHEVGLAIDFENCGHGSAVWNWLSAHAAEYGFYNLPSESWHWSTTGS